MTTVDKFRTLNKPEFNRHAEKVLVDGVNVSVVAGLSEEIVFRWLLFLNAIWFLKLSNWMFFGWLGFGMVEHLYLWVLAPVANFFTLGQMSHLFYHQAGWFVGAAMITANAKFRDGHMYLGFLGFVNSWFIGMYLFWVMFRYGLPAAILVHFLYDLFIFCVIYVDAAIERSNGNC